MPQVFKRAAARRDLLEHYVYLAENADIPLADRFIDAAERTFSELAEQPDIGAPVSSKRAQLAGLRKWRVRDFEQFLIFYFPRPAGASILRVLYANQDWWRALDVERT